MRVYMNSDFEKYWNAEKIRKLISVKMLLEFCVRSVRDWSLSLIPQMTICYIYTVH